MQATDTKTGAEEAAESLAAKLRAAGWEISTSHLDTQPYRAPDGSLMISRWRQVGMYASGPRSAGRPDLHAYWHTVIDAADGDRIGDTEFSKAEIRLGGTTRDLDTWAALDSWVDALIAVAAAVDA